MSIVSPHEDETQQQRRYIRLELGRRKPQDVPFGSLLSYGPNGSPTITVTKTLFSAAVTSTQVGDLTGNIGGLTTKFVVVSSASDNVSTSTITQTTTNIRTYTLTSTKTSTLSSSSPLSSSSSSSSSTSPSSLSTLTTTHASLDSSATLNLFHSSNTSEISNTLNTLGSHILPTSHTSPTQTRSSNSSSTRTPSSTTAGATLGSMAALVVLGALAWLYCKRRKTIYETMRTKLGLGRRESVQPPTTPWLENQFMEQTRSIMLHKSMSMKNRSDPVVSEMPDTALRRGKSMTESPVSNLSRIGVAVSSSTQPRTLPLPRLQPQVTLNHSYPAYTAPDVSVTPTASFRNMDKTSQSLPEQTTSFPMLVPPKPVMRKPVGTSTIITNARLSRHEKPSPPSPRGMFNALGNNTREAWKRASQALSPGSRYNVAKKEGQGEFQFLDKDGSLRKDETGLQDSKRIEGVERRATLFGRRSSRSSTKTENKGCTGQWI